MFANCEVGKSIVSNPDNSKRYWKYSHSDSVLSLCEDSNTIQDLYYVDGGIDSFWLFDQSNGVVFALKTNEISFDSVFSAFVSKIDNTDSFKVTIWKPVRKGYTYQVSIYKDGALYKDFNFIDNPLPSFHIPKEIMGDQIYTIEYTIYKDKKKTFGPYVYQPLKFKKGRIDHGR